MFFYALALFFNADLSNLEAPACHFALGLKLELDFEIKSINNRNHFMKHAIAILDLFFGTKSDFFGETVVQICKTVLSIMFWTKLISRIFVLVFLKL